ncbi:type II secretion system F family protein [Acetobacter sp. DsW_063]|uniref:type II secretion system F family protein n=1 Tax=Acetobacter sp. DsW_063 TaxID=1514894 RepID=UPI000B67D2A1|nr:type II secretion system F family protein [Acetobacter sp. DsW_063]OUJ16838.1 type II secretion system protein [Acetobacter sp. DsW_063]
MSEIATTVDGASRWTYRALGSDGGVTTGEIVASTEQQALMLLKRRKLTPLLVAPASRGGALRSGLGGWLARRRDPVLRPKALTEFTRQLATMLSAGLDLDRGLRFLAETSPHPQAARAIGLIRDKVRDGGSFAEALEASPRSFSRLYVGLVKAGEAGGALKDSLLRLADLLERERKMAATIQSAMIYPTVLMIASVFSVVLLLTHVLPQFTPLFAENGAALPTPTKIVIASGDFLSAWGVYMLAGLIGAIFAMRAALQRPDIRLTVDRALLQIPILGTLTREIMAARLTRTLGALMRNGVPLVGALRITEGIIGNRVGAAVIADATRAVREGGSLAAALERGRVYPVAMTHFLHVGEETAQLAVICLKAADIHEEASRVTIQRLLAILVPAITIIMGVLVAGIVSALLLAMLSLNDLAQ